MISFKMVSSSASQEAIPTLELMRMNFRCNWAALFNNYVNISKKQTSFFANFFVYIVYKILLA